MHVDVVVIWLLLLLLPQLVAFHEGFVHVCLSPVC